MVIAELAVIALVCDLFEIRLGQFRDVAVVAIDAIEQRVKGRAQIETSPAAVANLVDPVGLLIEIHTAPRRCNEIQSFHAGTIMQSPIVV